MNEYFVEDEYSFYEIDPKCKIVYGKREGMKEQIRKTESGQHTELTADGCREEETCCRTKRMSSQGPCYGCSLLLLCVFFSKIWIQIKTPGPYKTLDKKHLHIHCQ